MSGIVLLVAAIAAVALGGALGARLLGLTDALDHAIATVLLAALEVVVVSIVAGAMLERYERWPLLLGALLWDAALAVAVFRLRPRPPQRLSVASTLHALRPWQVVLVAAAVLALAWRLVLAVVLPPFAYDALAYHLTAAASWVQDGRIGPNPYAACCSRYPSNAELLFGWPTVFLGRDTLTDVVQIFAAVLGALAVAGLARAAGVSRSGALTAASLFLLTPIVLTQANTDYNDLTLAALFLAGLYFAARCAAEARLAFLLLAGVSAGLALGTKTNGVVLALGVGVGVAAALICAARDGASTRRSVASGLAVFATAVLLAGGWWYGKSWVETGNPVWPFRVSAFGTTVFQGSARLHDYLTVPPGGSRNAVVEIGRSWYQDLRFWTRSDYSYEERSGGLGPVWSWLGWPALAIAGVLALARRRDLVAVVLVPCALVFGVLPYRWWSRFTIYLAALGAIAILALLERGVRSRLRVPAAAVVVALALAGGALASWTLDPAGYGRKLSAADVVSLAVHPSRPRTAGSLFFREFAWLEHAPDDAAVAVEFDAPSIRFLYPLFGAKLDRRVVLLRPGDERRVAALVRATPAAYLFVEQRGAFARWARARPRRFRSIATVRGTEVFRIETILRR